MVAGAAARFTVHEAVVADPDIELRLAEAAELIALALRFGHFTLGATIFGAAGPGRHGGNLSRNNVFANVPKVTCGVFALFLIVDC